MTRPPRLSRLYASRSSAMRAARQACRKALDAPAYEASEGPDFLLHPQAPEDDLERRMSFTPHRYELCGPAAEILPGDQDLTDDGPSP